MRSRIELTLYLAQNEPVPPLPLRKASGFPFGTLRDLRLRLGGIAVKNQKYDGKPEAFRKESGQAAKS